MSFKDNVTLAPAGSNTATTYAAVPVDLANIVPVIHLGIDTTGASPSITFKVQGSINGNNWFDVPYLTTSSDTLSNAATTLTSGAALLYVMRPFAQYRLVVSAINNITFHADVYPIPSN